MRVPNNVLFVVVLLLIAVSTINTAIIFQKQGAITGFGTQAEVSFTVIGPPAVITAPENVNIFLNADDSSADINWSVVNGADNYIVYYSNNMTTMRDIDTGNLASNINSVTVSQNNWTDSNAANDVVRFYRVAAKKGSVTNVSKTLLGKQTYNLKASSDAAKRNNLIALVHNYDYNFSKYLNTFCLEYPYICDSNLGIPTIQAIDRSNPQAQPWVTHPYGFQTGATYIMRPGGGYKLLVNQTYDKTEVGIMPTLIFVNLTASNDASKRNNLFGDNYIESETFSDYLNKICAQELQICDSNLGIPTIQAIDRSDTEAQPWVTHPYGFQTGADYEMKSGEGYKILVNETIILILNNTVTR